MQKLTNQELTNIYGGLSISGSLISSFVKGINSFLDIGRSLGTAIRRIVSSSMCQF